MKSSSQLYYDIFKSIRTVSERVNFLDGVEKILQFTYHSDVFTTEALVRCVGQAWAIPIEQVLREGGIALGDKSGMKDFFTGLTEYAKQVEVIHATVALPEDEAIRSVLGIWLERCFPDKPAVVDIVTDPHIVGGVQIDYKGHYWDYSLKNQVNRVFREKKDELFSPQTKTA